MGFRFRILLTWEASDKGASQKDSSINYRAKTQAVENGSVMLARFSNTYKCTKI